MSEGKFFGESSTRLPSLDGWRALSILLVLGAHSIISPGFPPILEPSFKWVCDGNLGVRIFFVISGLLITWLMLYENHLYGRISLPHFFIRRALRILPVYFAFLGVLAGMQAMSLYQQPPVAWIANVTFTTNYVVDRAGATGHLWSLAIEEQFYLIWPAVLVWAKFATDYRKGLWLIITVIALSPLFRIITYTKMAPQFIAPLFSWGSPLNYFDSLAFGCGSAILLFYKRDQLEQFITIRPKLIACISVGLVLIPHVLAHYKVVGMFTVPFQATLQALGISLLILQSIFQSKSGIFKLLNNPWVCKVGILSYSIYIWHMITWQTQAFSSYGNIWWRAFPGWIVTGIGVAVISYYFLEKPLFQLRSKLKRQASVV